MEFNKIIVNERNGVKEIIFRHNNKWYRMDWSDVPEKFKILYVFELRLHGYSVPDDLIEYQVDTIDASNLDIELDISKAEEISETYPL